MPNVRDVLIKIPKLARYVDSRYLTGDDLQFVEQVTKDIHSFVTREDCAEVNRVLLFPPVDSYHRLLIHKTVEECEDLHSFSVGEGNNRRTAVCRKHSLLRDNSCWSPVITSPAVSKGDPRPWSEADRGWCHGPSPGENLTDPADHRAVTTNRNISPPPGHIQKTNSAMENRDRASNPKSRQRTKRPEMQIYVPKGRRMQQQQRGEGQGSQNTATDNTASSDTEKPPDLKLKPYPGSNPLSESTSSNRSHSLVHERHCDGDKLQRRSLSPQCGAVGRGRAKPSRLLYSPKSRPAHKRSKQDSAHETDVTNSSQNHSRVPALEHPHSLKFPGKEGHISDSTEAFDSNARLKKGKTHDTEMQVTEETENVKMCISAPLPVPVAPPGGEKVQDLSAKSNIPTDSHNQTAFSYSDKSRKRSQNDLEPDPVDRFADALVEPQQPKMGDIHDTVDKDLEPDSVDQFADALVEPQQPKMDDNRESVDVDKNVKHNCNFEAGTVLSQDSCRMDCADGESIDVSTTKPNDPDDLHKNNTPDSHIIHTAITDQTLPPADNAVEASPESSSLEAASSPPPDLAPSPHCDGFHSCLVTGDQMTHLASQTQTTDSDRLTGVSGETRDSTSGQLEDGAAAAPVHNESPSQSGSATATDLIPTSSVTSLPAEEESIRSDESIAIDSLEAKKCDEIVLQTDRDTDSGSNMEVEDPEGSFSCDFSVQNDKIGTTNPCSESQRPAGQCDVISLQSLQSVQTLTSGTHFSDGSQLSNQHQEVRVPSSTSHFQETPPANENVEADFEPVASTGLGSVAVADSVTMESDDEEDEESWDKLFTDDGDCLDPKIMEELTTAVGSVQVEKPQAQNYYKYQPKEPDVDLEAYDHVIEISEFPAEFLTRDLISAFQPFMSRGFDIKWVDDTHALGIFSSAIAARDALEMQHPMLKVRPLSQADKQCKLKAKRCVEFLQPYKPRPETSASAARRLVTGALGLAPRVSREKREQERQQLKEAKARRKQDKRNKDDAWEGNYGKCAMDEES